MNKDLDLIKVLKDCPKGTKFYSKCFGELTLHCIIDSRICLKDYSKFNRIYEKDGKYVCCDETAEIDLLPSKDQRDWSKWHRPFVDGDIIFTRTNNPEYNYGWLSIFKEIYDNNCISYLDVYLDNFDYSPNIDMVLCDISEIVEQRLATEKEKQKLFDVIKVNGYKWDADKKKLEKLIIPKFKVGDEIKHRLTGDTYKILFVLSNGCDGGVYDVAITDKIGKSIAVEEQDNYELIPNKFNPEKFDIKTLIPFESKVLVRDEYNYWCGSIYTGYKNNKFHTVDCSYYNQCIPYKGNEHLLGTKDDCEEYYKIW